MRDYKKYKVWQLGHEVTLRVYKLTAGFPDEEKFGLISQMRRASSSIPANIAEGSGRNSDKDFVRFLYYANESANELEYFIILSEALGFIKNEALLDELNGQIEILKKSLNKLISKIEQ